MNLFDIKIPKEVYMPIIIILVALILERLCNFVIKITFNSKKKHKKLDPRKILTIRSLLCNITKYLIWIIASLYILSIFGINTAAIITGLGVASLVIGLAFQDMLKDILAGISIIFEGQFAVGDLVTIEDFTGYVISLGLKSTKIRGFKGEVEIISNRNINKVINYSLKQNVAVVEIPVAYEEELEKVEKVLSDFANEAEEKIDTIVAPPRILDVEKLDDSAVVYRVECDCKPATTFATRRKVNKEIKMLFDKNNIKIPYMQVEVHNEK